MSRWELGDSGGSESGCCFSVSRSTAGCSSVDGVVEVDECILACDKTGRATKDFRRRRRAFAKEYQEGAEAARGSDRDFPQERKLALVQQ